MIENLSTVFRYFIFWLLFFFLERLIFILAFIEKVKVAAITEIGKSFLIGPWMDISMAAYISALPLLIALIVWFIPTIKISENVLRWYTKTLIVLFSIICAFNFNIYREWGAKINFKAIEIAFISPNEAIASGASSPVFASIVMIILLVSLSIWLSDRIIRYRSLKKVNVLLKIGASVLLIGLNFLAIRGGLQLSPMNESMAYYSNTPILNHAAVNTEWSLLRDILKNKSTKNPYLYYPKDEAANLVNEILETPQGSHTDLLTSSKPNVVLIILEGFTADVVESLGGEKGVAPQMEKLASEGVLFDNIYASGDRTDKGVVAILNAFPSQATKSIMKLNGKQAKLPSLAKTFAENAYSTSFFYGGESEFFNMKSYLLSHRYQDVIDKGFFEKKDMNSKWGAFDDLVYNRLLSKANTSKQPFFFTLLTLTNHEPFELPGKPRFSGESVENKFRSTAFYTDSCLSAFLNSAKKESWYNNTLFIVVADHGHRLPKNQYEIYHPNRFRIPLLFLGEVIKPEFRGKRISKIGSQTDIASTLFNQLKMPSEQFKWSRDILDSGTPDFAFFDWDNGFSVVTPEQAISFDNTGKNILFKADTSLQSRDENLLRYGKAYMQQVFQDFLDY